MRKTLMSVIAAVPTALGLLLAAPGVAAAQEDMIHLSDCGLLLEGQSSTCVALLQLSLNETGAPYGLTADGVFGPGTRIALLDFQGRNHLGADGNAGPQVIAALIGKVGDHNALDLDGRNPYPTGSALPGETINPNTGRPYDPCSAGTVRYNGECYDPEFLDGKSVWGGKTVVECADDATRKAVKNIIAAENAKEAGKRVGRQIGKKLLTVPSVFKCMLWD
jgi:peptidoglycan hydrolase-like protein with peptidoglycan-binding domain